MSVFTVNIMWEDLLMDKYWYYHCASTLQIQFLNSVIVDLQRKNEELKDKLEKMAAASLNGNNPSELDNYDRCVLSSAHV